MTEKSLRQLFDQQVDTLIQKGYPEAAKLSEETFYQLLAPLKSKLASTVTFEIDYELGRLPFVIVVKNELVSAKLAMSQVTKDDHAGMIKLYPCAPEDFRPIARLLLPPAMVYLLTDIDRGKETINQAPRSALPLIQTVRRSPLTIDEGIAVVTHFPDFLRKNNCFSLLASRRPGDKRVPAIWINAKKQPHLGWC